MFWLKNVEGDVPGENIKLSYVGNNLRKKAFVFFFFLLNLLFLFGPVNFCSDW